MVFSRIVGGNDGSLDLRRMLPWLVGALVATACLWSFRRAGAPEGAASRDEPPATVPRLVDVVPSSEPPAEAVQGVGTVVIMPGDRSALVLRTGDGTVALSPRTAIGSDIVPGDTVSFTGRRTGGTRFGGVYASGDARKVGGPSPRSRPPDRLPEAPDL
ncbi:MAG: hypothetical protein HY815_28205 [Candidatus Riflebacteria bacterium]|nr:hypothetical protein [Candidatus Riflebacteria bacterium]